MNKLISIAALSIALLAPVSFTTPALAEGTPFCHTKAVNGDVIDPPQCNDARAVQATGGGGTAPAVACDKNYTNTPCLV